MKRVIIVLLAMVGVVLGSGVFLVFVLAWRRNWLVAFYLSGVGYSSERQNNPWLFRGRPVVGHYSNWRASWLGSWFASCRTPFQTQTRVAFPNSPCYPCMLPSSSEEGSAFHQLPASPLLLKNSPSPNPLLIAWSWKPPPPSIWN